MSRESLERVPALAAAVAFHVVVLLLAIMLGNMLNQPGVGDQVTTVTLMSAADVAAARDAMQADQSQEASTPSPAPLAPEPTPAPAPTPTPTPAPSQPNPAPQPRPEAKPNAKPAKPAPTMDFDALAQNLEASAKASGGRPSSARPGAPRPATSIHVHSPSGANSPAAKAAIASMQDGLQRLWNPSCEVLGGNDITIVLHYAVEPGGILRPKSVSSTEGNSADPLIRAASDRAVRAVYQYFDTPGTPTANLPPDNNYTANFNPKQSCTQR